MMTSTKTLSLTLLGGVSGLAMLQPAMALDAQAFADRLTAVYQKVGYAITVPDAKLKGDTIVLENVTIAIQGMEATGEITTTLTFAGVTEGEDGSYMAETMTVPDIEFDIEEEVPGHVSLTDIVAEDFFLPAGDTISSQLMLQLFGSLHTGPLVVTRNDEEVIAFDSIEAVTTFNPAQGAADLVDLESVFAINGISIDLSSLAEEDPQAGPVIEGLGLTNISGNINQTLSWSMADGRMVVDQFLFDFPEIGALDITLDYAGLTPALMDQMYALQAKMLAEGADPASEEAQAQAAMQGMQMAQAITLTSASVRYDDDSLAGKLLDFFASAQGVERAQMVEGLKAMVPQMAAGMGVPALADVIQAPVNAFLDDPQSLEVSVQPETPASLLVLTGAAANPAGLIQVLGLSVSANEEATE